MFCSENTFRRKCESGIGVGSFYFMIMETASARQDGAQSIQTSLINLLKMEGKKLNTSLDYGTIKTTF